MPYARRKSFGRRSYGRRRSSSRMRPVHEPRRWERGNFRFAVDHLHDPSNGPEILTTVPIAQPDHIIDFSTAGSVADSLSQAVRCLEIGGIVLHAFCVPTDIGGPVQPDLGDLAMIEARMLLVSDRLDASVPPIPIALACDWFTNTQPVVYTAEDKDRETNFPTQIHHQEAWLSCRSGSTPVSLTGDIPYLTTVESVRRTRSKRLRLRLQDRETLEFQFASQLSSGADETHNYAVRFLVIGTIYYRYVFGRG